MQLLKCRGGAKRAVAALLQGQLPVAATGLQVRGQLEGAMVAKFVALCLAHQSVVVIVVGGTQQVAQVLDVQRMVRVFGQDLAIEHRGAVHPDGLEPLVGTIGHHHIDTELAQGLGQRQ